VLGCATPATPPAAPPAPPAGAADAAYHLLEGQFDSADQARSSPGYAAFQIVACPADAPALGPRVLYVEQTRIGDADMPYRQRVYALEPGDPVDSVAAMRVFELAAPGSAVGACRGGSPPRFAREDLVERVGCAFSLHTDGAVLRGGTSGRGCPTTQKGATYMTAELVVGSVAIHSWEHGFDAAGTRRWGVETGPYVFVRRTARVGP